MMRKKRPYQLERRQERDASSSGLLIQFGPFWRGNDGFSLQYMRWQGLRDGRDWRQDLERCNLRKKPAKFWTQLDFLELLDD